MRWIRCKEGEFDREHIPVTSDALDIVKRIKELDDHYFVMFNRNTQKYEVHVKGQRCSLGCILPYDGLDARAVLYVREHDISRLDAIVKAIDEEEEEREKASRKRVGEIAEGVTDYAMWDSNRN